MNRAFLEIPMKAVISAIVHEFEEMSHVMHLSDINIETNKQLRRIVVVRVLKMWTTKNTKTQKEVSIEFLLIDSEGTIIQSSAMSKFIARFRKKLSEGNVFMIQDFNVENNDKKYWQRTRVNNPYKLGFSYETDATAYMDNKQIDLYGFKFVSFEDIQGNVDEEYYVDVIGAVFEWGEMEEIRGSNFHGRKMSCFLRDLDGNSIECILWEQYGDELIESLTKIGDTNEPIILTLQFGRKDFYKVARVSTTRNESKIAINLDCKEVHDFNKGIRSQGGISTSRSITRTESYHNNKWDWFSMERAKNLQQLIDTNEAGWYSVKAYAKTFDFAKGWCYRACASCNSKVTIDAIVGDFCKHPRCNGPIHSLNSRFCLRLVVVDQYSTATFILWENIVKKFVTQTAEELLKILKEDDSEESPPDEFKVILKQYYLFKVKVHDKFNIEGGSKEYIVDDISSDDTNLKKFEDLITNEVVSLPIQKDPPTTVQSVEFVDVDECNSNSSSMTPMKRTSKEFIDDDICYSAGQQSSTKIIKIEK